MFTPWEREGFFFAIWVPTLLRKSFRFSAFSRVSPPKLQKKKKRHGYGLTLHRFPQCSILLLNPVKVVFLPHSWSFIFTLSRLLGKNFHLDRGSQNAITASSCAWSHSAIKRVLANAHTAIGKHSQIMARYNCYLVSVFGGGSSYWFVSKKLMPFSEGCYKRLGYYSFLARNAAAAEKLARQTVSF
jgi:hypothetical protein